MNPTKWEAWWHLSTPPRHRYRTWTPNLGDLDGELDARHEDELRRVMDRLERQAHEAGRELASEHTIRWVRLAADRVLDTCDAIEQLATDDARLRKRAGAARSAADAAHRRADDILIANQRLIIGIGDSGGSNIARLKHEYIGAATEAEWIDETARH